MASLPPWVLDDPLALSLVGEEGSLLKDRLREALPGPGALSFSRWICVRARLAEDIVEQAVVDGIRQYVILGAGLDSFACRRPDLLVRLRVFEVDHPASQAWKRQRLEDLGIPCPANLIFAPVEFERQTLGQGLEAGGFDVTAPAVFSYDRMSQRDAALFDRTVTEIVTPYAPQWTADSPDICNGDVGHAMGGSGGHHSVRLPVIFLDDGGVMNDNQLRGPQWQRLVGEYLAPILGGQKDAWARANMLVAERIWSDQSRALCDDPHMDIVPYLAGNDDRWLSEMCEEVGVAPPAERAARLRLAHDTIRYVTQRVRAAFPGAVEAIQRLRASGYRVHTASNETELELRGYLSGMDVLQCFGKLFGVDLVGVAKTSPLYYERIFGSTRVRSLDALVIDDNERTLNWAASTGARTVLCHAMPPSSDRHMHIPALSALPTLLAEMSG